MLNDRELLELAALSANVSGRFVDNEPIQGDFHTGIWSDLWGTCWNPLEDDRDAFRLAVRLGVSINPPTGEHDNSKYYYTRRAIVLAAAEIGKKIKDAAPNA